MLTDPRRTIAVLQVLSLLSLGSAALVTLSGVPAGTGGAVAAALTFVLAALCIAVLWAIRARLGTARGRAACSVAVVVLSTPAAMLGTVGFAIPELILAVALAVIDLSVLAGALSIAWISLLGVVLHLVRAADPLSGLAVGLVNAVPLAVLLCFGLALGAALRGYESRRARDQEVIERLRRAAATEKELVLADERARSARDLHDGLGHRLTVVVMSLDFAERMRERDARRSWEEIAAARDVAQDALAHMRTWVRALSPVRVPEARGLAALEAIAESFRGTGLSVRLEAERGADAALRGAREPVSLLVYRAVQEGLANALRHARAREVLLAVTAADGSIGVRLCNDLDDRARREVPEGPAAEGFGLRALAERAATHGGHVRAAREGERFVLTLHLPDGAER
ncbi:sensor histidine kinase [Brachybacterium sp. YJGR34]|uniref:sensor histidine kinase n=1 Tax=Brachybacterium sp. YJGR34 TaxID=2059911 RepID=UPI000E0AAD13|nr:histidine kinase [Brachybacterium sp. YJGR34]